MQSNSWMNSVSKYIDRRQQQAITADQQINGELVDELEIRTNVLNLGERYEQADQAENENNQTDERGVAARGVGFHNAVSNESGCRWKNLVRVEYPLRVELRLDAAHQVEGRRVDGERDVVALFAADAVFAGERAAEANHQIEHLPQARARVFFLARVLRVVQQVHVNVAIAGVAEVHDRYAEFAGSPCQSGDQLA